MANKGTLITKIYQSLIKEECYITKKNISKIVDQTFSSIIETVRQGQRFSYPGFGSFNLRKTNPRTIIDPRKVKHEVPERFYLRFRSHNSLKKHLNPPPPLPPATKN